MAIYTFDQAVKKAGIKPSEVTSEGINTPEPTATTSNDPGFLSRTGGVINRSGAEVYESIAGEGKYQGQSAVRRGTQAVATAFSTPLSVAKEALPSPVRGGIDFVGGKVGEGFNWLTDKIGDNKQLQQWTVDNPEAFNQLTDILGTTSAAGEIAGSIATYGKSAQVAQKGVDAGVKVATNAKNTIASGTKGIVDTTSAVVSKAKGAVGVTPPEIMQRVARISKAKQAKFQNVSGESVGEYLTKRGIYGNVDQITTKLYDRFTKSKATADGAFEKLKGTFEPEPVKTALKELVARETRVSAAGAQSPYLDRASSLLKKINEKGLNMSEINEVKRLFEKNVKVDYLKSVASNPEGVVRATNIDSAIRGWQYKQAETLGLKNLKAINNETRFSKQLLDDLGQEYAGVGGNNAMSLTDWIMLSGGDPTAIGGFLVKKGASSKTVQSAIAEYMNKGKPIMGDVKADIGTSQVLQLEAGTPGAPKVQINQPINLRGPSTMEKGVSKRTSTLPQQLSLEKGKPTSVNNTTKLTPLQQQNLDAAVQLRNSKLLNAGDKVLSNSELKELAVPGAPGNAKILYRRTQGGFVNPTAMIKDAKAFLRKVPPYGLLEDMAEYTNLFYARKLNPVFEANLRDALAKFDPKLAALPSGKLSETFGAILDEARFSEVKK